MRPGERKYVRRPSPPTSLPYCVRTVGRNRNLAYHSTLGTYHDDVMLTLVISGRGRYIRQGKTTAVEPGMVGIVLPQKDPGFLSADPSDPYDHFYCRFSGHMAVESAARISAKHEGRAFFKYESWDILADAFLRMIAMPVGQSRRGDGTEQMCPVDAMLVLILSILDIGLQKKEDKISKEKITLYMQDHISSPASLDEMAAAFNISKAYLCRIGKNLLGNTVLDVWQELKMDWAETLLKNDSLSIADIARHTGFKDPFYFSKVFKSIRGISPARWRARCRQMKA